VAVAQNLCPIKKRQEKDLLLALFIPDDLKKAEESGTLDIDVNCLGLHPNPVLVLF